MKRIFRVLLIVSFLSSIHAPLAAADQCERWEQARVRVYQQLRKGYSTSRGNQLRARLRELSELIAHNCR